MKNKRQSYAIYNAFCKMLCRASAVPDCPEKNMIVSVIANAILDEANPKRVPIYARSDEWIGGFGDGWFNKTLQYYCDVLHINHDYIHCQIMKLRGKL